MVHNPEVKVNYIPDDIITSSGSGLDPHISYEGAFIQIARISKARNIDNATLNNILIQHIDKPFLGIFTKPKVNVLKLNMALDNLGNISNQNKN